MYIATEEGLNWYDMLSEKINESQDNGLDNVPITKLAALDTMSLLLATRNGLYKYSIRKDRFTFYKTASSMLDIRLTAVAVNNDTLWIANEYGIALCDLETGSWRSFMQVMTRLTGNVNDIQFTEGIVWFATDSGLLKYDIMRDYWYLYTTEDGLAHNRVYHIDIDGDDLWLSTYSGVTIFRWYRPERLE
jgi:ligand-binding sensor domain-containing protein